MPLSASATRTFTSVERALSLAAVIAAALGVGVSFGVGYPLTALTLESWHEPKWVLGFAGAAPSLAVLIILPILPGVVGRVGAVPAIATGCILAAFGFLALSMVSTAWAWIAIRFAMSAGIALPWLVGETWINTVSTDGTRGRVIALYAIAFFAGFAIGPQLIDWLGTSGFKPFLAGAIATAIAGGPIVLARRLAPDLTHDNPVGTRTALGLAPIGMIGGFIGGFAEMTYLSLMPSVSIASGVSESESLWLLTLLTIGGGILQFPIGWLADKMNKVTLSLMLALAFVGLSFLLSWALTKPTVAPVMAFGIGGVVLGFYTVGLSIIGEQVDARDIAAANAAFLIMYQLGSIIGPLVAGVAMTAEPVVGFIATVCSLMILSALALWMFTSRR